MTKEPQPTTHNTEHGARSMFRERSDTGSSPKRTEKSKLLADRQKVLEIWEKVFGNFGANMWRNTLEVCGKHIRRHGENLFGDFQRKNLSAIWRNR